MPRKPSPDVTNPPHGCSQPQADTASAVRSDRHAAAVARSLGWAEEAAERGDYADALRWVQMLEAIGEPLGDGLEAKRRIWLSALSSDRTAERSTGRTS